MADRLESHVQNLVAAGLGVTPGDERCMRFGLLAEEAIRRLSRNWDRSLGIKDRMTMARNVLLALDDEEPPRPADLPLTATG